MKELRLEGLSQTVSGRIAPFVKEIMAAYDSSVHSIHIVGSAVTPDFNEKTSVIHSVIITHDMAFGLLSHIASLGGRYKKKGIAAPLVLTNDYIKESIDVFPIEFHDFRMIHKTILGDDVLSTLEIEREHLRLQCEREIKARLIGIRQNYISSLGERKYLSDILSKSILGVMPILRAIIFLFGKEPPVKRRDAVSMFQEMTSIDVSVFSTMLQIRSGQLKPSSDDLFRIFQQYHSVLEQTGKAVDGIH